MSPFHLKFVLKLTHFRLKSADFNHYLLIMSEPQELAKNVQLSRIGSRNAFQRPTVQVRILPLTPPKGGSKSEIVVVVNKIQL